MRRVPLPPSTISLWAEMNGVKLEGVSIEHREDGPYGGGGFAVIARRDLTYGTQTSTPLMTVPRNLVLSAEGVHDEAKYDTGLREVLEAAPELAMTTRSVVLLYLIVHLTGLGVSGPWTQYLRSLSSPRLPTTWTEEQQEWLMGTSLEAALKAKNARLAREYDYLRTATESIPWCRTHWWTETDSSSQLTYDDWVLVDSLYRSRALSFSVAGEAMVPGVDMINHSMGEDQNAYFERDTDGNAVLLMPPNKSYLAGEEITISYGDSKSASEMLFSYGFIDADMKHSTGVTLDLTVPDDDPLGKAKEAACVSNNTATAVRIWFDGRSTTWQSQFLWLMCVNEEDGLQFQLAHRNDGGQELKMSFQGQDLSEDTARLEDMLRADPLWPVFHLRGLAVLQERLQAQIHRLDGAADLLPVDQANDLGVNGILGMVKRLRSMEMDLLDRFAEDLITQGGFSLRNHVEMV
ncbi:MAG: hypothetical protein M1816_007837 [Peltula sp. TS41687]|nr:MAG: hypothetical protein M1816_007837 [Peltula sp. TS41687]